LIELADHHFQDLCADPEVRRILAEANRNGGRTSLGFWAILVLGLLLVAAATIIAFALDRPVLAVIVGGVGMLAVYVIAAIPLAMAGRAIKLPVFQRLAARHGLAYAPLTGLVPLHAEASPHLFDVWLTTESFTDLFQGKDERDHRFATWQTYLARGSGGDIKPVFNGRVFAFERRTWGKGRILIVPAGRYFGSTRGTADMRPVTLGDAEFERWFQVHATVEAEARALLGPEARRMLLALRKGGKLRIYAGLGDILVALDGRKGFTPGLGFFFRRGEARVRAMFDDLADSLHLLRTLKAGLDP